MKKIILCLLGGLFAFNSILAQPVTPESSHYNTNIQWRGTYGVPTGEKANKIVADSDGNIVAISCPEPSPFIVKIDGDNGNTLWAHHLTSLQGMFLGLEEIPGNERVDYIVSGGTGSTRERYVARLNGDTGQFMWQTNYTYTGNQYQYDYVRNVTVGSDGYIYGSGHVQGDEIDSFFVVYAGTAFLMKIDPDTGQEEWTSINSNNVEFAAAHQEAADGYIYYAGAGFETDLSITRVNKSSGVTESTVVLRGTEEIIPSDLALGPDDWLYLGGHTGRSGSGDPFDYTCIKLDTSGVVAWTKDYANPRGYSLESIRNELYGIKTGTDGIYMFGGSGSESEYTATTPPFPEALLWVGWVLITDFDGNILRSDVLYHDEGLEGECGSTATEYGDVIPGGYVVCNDTDVNYDTGETDIGVMKVMNGYNLPIGLADNDADGLDDGWEQKYFGGTNVTRGGPQEDADADGLSNEVEYIAGTSPTNDSSRFEVELSRSNGEVVVSFYGIEASGVGYEGLLRKYTLEYSTNLATPPWVAVPGYTNLAGLDLLVSHTNDLIALSYYYRAKAWLE